VLPALVAVLVLRGRADYVCGEAGVPDVLIGPAVLDANIPARRHVPRCDREAGNEVQEAVLRRVAATSGRDLTLVAGHSDVGARLSGVECLLDRIGSRHYVGCTGRSRGTPCAGVALWAGGASDAWRSGLARSAGSALWSGWTCGAAGPLAAPFGPVVPVAPRGPAGPLAPGLPATPAWFHENLCWLFGQRRLALARFRVP
jgi:hypothetical protein